MKKSTDVFIDNMYSKCVMRIDLDEDIEGFEAKNLYAGDSIDAGQSLIDSDAAGDSITL